MDVTPEQLVAQLESGPLQPAYLIAGAEPLLVLEAADAVRAAARRDGIGEREVFEAGAGQREPDWDAMSASFNAPSLFATRRLVELRLPSGKPGKEGAKLIAEFCANPSPDVVLLVTCEDWSRSHGGDWSQAIGRIGRVAVAWPVKPHELPGWIDRRLRSRGFSPDRDAVMHLAERVEGNLLAAAQEVEKLALLFRDAPDAPRGGRPLTLDTLQSLVADASRYDVFRLIDAAMNGQPAQVVRILAGLRAEGDAVPALLGMIVMELHRGGALAQVQAKGGNLVAAFKAQRVWDAKQPMYRRALQRHAPAAWEAMLVQAGLVDRIAKGRAPGDAWVALERLMVALAERGATRLLAAG
ncbi:DNA polymerase III subunit delta [Lysobacter xinjiangensis]|uniref:DNA polymerase III subunit delta n=1 Tax=Cognatilysobacter xinjiangensis TaxID=546892 RepID=A0ABQ3BUY6_9GAMM|nr:DNA polymerase III subunit delta [Lysobacter xinjiangensis]GGZ54902.1 DNA polymerase III subunit delta [Lysobacter xinjiangensis]